MTGRSQDYCQSEGKSSSENTTADHTRKFVADPASSVSSSRNNYKKARKTGNPIFPNTYAPSTEESNKWKSEVIACFPDDYSKYAIAKYFKVDSPDEIKKKSNSAKTAYDETLKYMTTIIEEDDSDSDSCISVDSYYNFDRML